MRVVWTVLAGATLLTGGLAPQSAWGQSAGELSAMLGQAQRFTVKVRSTVAWPFGSETASTGLGTGFIIDRDKGWILTNAHVARRSPATVEIAIGEQESEWLPVKRHYIDNHLDIAVLQIAAGRLPPDVTAARLGCRLSVKQGEPVVAYGHPISLNFTATRGIVSSVRTLNSHEFIQMDANINPGNSGGPLLATEAAEVIGINTANIAGAPGLGLALAIRHICPVIDLLAKELDPSVPSLPVYWLKQGRVETLTVAALFPREAGAPAAGPDELLPGDVVQAISGEARLAGLPDLYTALRGRRGEIPLEVLRDGQTRIIKARLIAARPTLARQSLTVFGMLVARRATLDSETSTLPPLRIEYIKSGEGASRIGLQTWDQIESVDGHKFGTVEELYNWLKPKKAADKTVLMIRRSSGADPRLSAEYHRFEIEPADLRLWRAGD